MIEKENVDVRRKSASGVVAHDTKRLRRNQIFEDGFDFTLVDARKEMAKLDGGFDKTKASLGTARGGEGVC